MEGGEGDAEEGEELGDRVVEEVDAGGFVGFLD